MPTESEKEAFKAARDADKAKEAGKAGGGCVALAVLLIGAGAYFWFSLNLDWGKYAVGAGVLSFIGGIFMINSSTKIDDKYK